MNRKEATLVANMILAETTLPYRQGLFAGSRTDLTFQQALETYQETYSDIPTEDYEEFKRGFTEGRESRTELGGVKPVNILPA